MRSSPRKLVIPTGHSSVNTWVNKLPGLSKTDLVKKLVSPSGVIPTLPYNFLLTWS